MTKKLKSGTPFVYDENDRVVGIRDPHTGTDTDLVTAVTGPGGGGRFITVGDLVIDTHAALSLGSRHIPGTPLLRAPTRFEIPVSYLLKSRIPLSSPSSVSGNMRPPSRL